MMTMNIIVLIVRSDDGINLLFVSRVMSGLLNIAFGTESFRETT